MPCHASPFNLQPQTDLRAEPIGRGVRSAKQGHDTDPLARPQELPCQFKSNASAGAVAGNNKRTVWLKGGDLRGKISCQLFDAAQRLRVAVEPRRLQSEKGLILAQMPHQRSISKNVAIVTGDRENRNFRAVWLERDDRALLTGNHRDFVNLHNLVMQATGHHSGILVVRRDNDPRRDLTPSGIVRAIQNLLRAGITISDDVIILNHWR